MPTELYTGKNNPVNGLQFFEDEASEWTVQFEVQPSNSAVAQMTTANGTGAAGTSPSGGVTQFDTEATIGFVVEGNKCTRRVSVCQGMSITGRGQGLQVQLNDVTDTSLTPSGVGYIVTALASRGVRAFSGFQPILRAPGVSTTSGGAVGSPGTFALPAGETRYMLIPKGAGVFSAGVFSVSTVIPPAVDPNLIVTARATAVGAVPLKAWNPVINPGYVPLPPSADELVFVNASGAAMFVSVDFGIEG